MNKMHLSMIIAIGYFLFCSIVIANELYTRVYDTGNSEMAGLASYLFTMPSSMFIDWLCESILGIKIGSSNVSFVFTLGVSASLNSLILYLILHLFFGLLRR